MWVFYRTYFPQFSRILPTSNISTWSNSLMLHFVTLLSSDVSVMQKSDSLLRINRFVVNTSNEDLRLCSKPNFHSVKIFAVTREKAGILSTRAQGERNWLINREHVIGSCDISPHLLSSVLLNEVLLRGVVFWFLLLFFVHEISLFLHRVYTKDCIYG